MSRLLYNGYILDHILTQSIEQEAVYSQPDGLDYLYTRFQVSVQALFNVNIKPASANGTVDAPATPSTSDVAALMKSIRHHLLQPRKTLAFWVDPANEPLFKVGANLNIASLANQSGSATCDAKRGPFPRSCRIKQVQGTECLLVDYTIEAFVNECDNDAPEISAHHFRETIGIDENFYSTRTRNGTVVLRGDHFKARGDEKMSIDQYRGKIIPAIPTGFKRESMEFVIQEDGLQMTYSIRDKEQYLQPPFPATKASGTYNVSSVRAGGAVKMAECRVSLEGPNTAKATKNELFKTAFLIAMTKVGGGKIVKLDGQRGNPLLMNASFGEQLWENKVDVTLKVKIIPSRTRAVVGQNAGAPTSFPGLGTPLPGVAKDGKPHDPGARGTAGLLNFVQPYLLNSCNGAGSVQDISQGGNPASGVAPTAVKVQVVGKLPQDAQAIHNPKAHDKGFYTDYMIYPRWQKLLNKLQMPLAISTGKQNSVITKIAKPTERLLLEWSAHRIGSPPEPPLDDPGRAGMELVSKHVAPELEVDGDGTVPAFTLRGRYEYAFTNDPKIVFPLGPLIDGKTISQRVFDVGKAPQISVFKLI